MTRCLKGVVVGPLLLLLVLLGGATAPHHLAAAAEYYYPIFESASHLPPQVDGVSGVGVLCRPGSDITVPKLDNIYLSDMCGGGSAIRHIHRDGISTLAGSKTEQGYVDGNATTARFNGFSQGSYLANGMCFAENKLFLADTGNNVIRVIDPTSGETDTFISSSSQLNGLPLNFPNFVAPYQQPQESTEKPARDLLFISDTSNRRILFTPIQFDITPPLTLAESSLQPGILTISSNLQTMYYVANTDSIHGLHLESNEVFLVGSSACTGYVSSLHLSYDSTEVLYYGQQDGVRGIYALPSDGSGATASGSSRWCGTLKFPWTYSSTVRAISVRNSFSYYIVSDYNAYILSTRELYFPPPNALEDRAHVILAFPTYPLPMKSSCLMSQFFYWVRVDSAIAFHTEDYYNQFAPVDDLTMLLNGTVNVSDWCSDLSEQLLNEKKTALLLNFYGPPGWSEEEVYDALRHSPWNYTIKFLESLHDGYDPSGPGAGGAGSAPFCPLNCEGEKNCTTIEIGKTDYCDYLKPTTTPEPTSTPKTCDEICVGGIVSASVMGLTLIILIVLAIISPANIFNAFFMFPII